MKIVLLALCLVVPSAVCAQAWLPAPALAAQAIEARPQVQAAQARLDAADAEARVRVLGPHELAVSVATQQRRVSDVSGNRHYPEFEAQLSRAFRWPNKVVLDREIGTDGVRAADFRLDDARHQAAVLLLERWVGWLRTADVARLAVAQLASLSRERAAVARRVELGDAARRELDLLDLEVARAEVARVAAVGEAELARTTLVQDFPGLPIPSRIPAVELPAELPEPDDVWMTRIVQRSHEIGAVVADAALADAMSARTRAERIPDPTIGLRTLSEFGGRERSIGIVLQMPLPGRARAAQAQAQAARAAALHSDAAAVRRAIQRDAQAVVQTARVSRARWQAEVQSLAAARAASRRMRRGWELGELSLADWLLVERAERQAELDEIVARIDANAARLRVLVDSHEFWHAD